MPPHTSKRRATSSFHHNLAQLFRHIDRNVVLVVGLHILTAYPDASQNYEDKNYNKNFPQ